MSGISSLRSATTRSTFGETYPMQGKLRELPAGTIRPMDDYNDYDAHRKTHDGWSLARPLTSIRRQKELYGCS